MQIPQTICDVALRRARSHDPRVTRRGARYQKRLAHSISYPTTICPSAPELDLTSNRLMHRCQSQTVRINKRDRDGVTGVMLVALAWKSLGVGPRATTCIVDSRIHVLGHFRGIG